MNKKRATSGAIIGLALTASGVFAASTQAPSSPDPVSVLAQDHSAVGGTNDNHGGAVSTLAKTTTHTSTTPDTTTPDTTTPDTSGGAQGAHGAAVSAVAQDQTLVGGTNNNHGGAVSLVARGTHGPAASHGNSASHSQASVHKPTH
jgi:hypothetical protein